ncbi:CK/CK1 protein kinase [Arthroderma uncinatum]|uniref:CK/CK1 protein kinase n=1 Tax=Arthroderma uncinatum TaxID=74035 RepID=UPI00144A9497|nr:CK/CK1 protein kinase [Arthroderma uncinatum]KAF3484300.1 CK/CK1 protein kinase [Arthroderma uncinatum]
MIFSWLTQCWGVRLKEPALALPGTGGDCVAAHDIMHVVQILSINDEGALIKVRTVAGEERSVYSSLPELKLMRGMETAVEKFRKNLPPDFESSACHNGNNENYRNGRKIIDNPETVEWVATYQGIEHARGKYLVWAEVDVTQRVKVIFTSVGAYSQCPGAVAAIPHCHRDTFKQYQKMEESGPRQPARETVDGYKLIKHIQDDVYVGDRQIQGAGLSGDDRKVTIKLEARDTDAPSLEREVENLLSFSGEIGFPLVERYGTQDGYRFMVCRLAGPTLEDLLEWCRAFSLKTVFLLAEQLISRVEVIHRRSFIHGGIRPGAFALDTIKALNQVTLVEVAGLITEHPRRNDARYFDLEGLTLMLIYMCRRLAPWEGLQIDLTKTLYEDILRQMEDTRAEVLCEGLPRAFKVCLEYVKFPDHTNEPDYNYLRQLFRSAFDENRLLRDGVFDWIAYKNWNSQQGCSLPVAGITGEVGSKRLSGEDVRRERNAQADLLYQAKEACVSIAKADKADWTAAASAHLELTRRYIDIWDLAQHPEIPTDLRRWPEGHQLQEKVWQIGIEPCLKLLEAGLPHTRNLMTGFLHRTFILLTVFVEKAPQYEEKCARYLLGLSKWGMEHDPHGSWAGVHSRWGESAGDVLEASVPC